MPQINKITDVLYDGNQPYHVEYDNLPLKNILTRIDLVNSQVDINSEILRGSSGTVGSLNNRLSVSLEDDGKLKSNSIDHSLHNIGAHQDGEYEGTEYVRMKKSERDKLELIQSESNKIEIEIEDKISWIDSDSRPPVEHVTITNGLIKLKSSDSVGLQFTAPDTITFHTFYSQEIAHIHHYEKVPAHESSFSPDYKNYKTTTTNTPFVEESLRIYINGFRISTIPTKILIDNNWLEIFLESYNKDNGSFVLSEQITSNDVILIDFDQKVE